MEVHRQDTCKFESLKRNSGRQCCVEDGESLGASALVLESLSHLANDSTALQFYFLFFCIDA